MKKIGLFGLAALAASSMAQVGVHVQPQFWNPGTFDRYTKFGLINASTKTLNIDSFEYTVGGNPNDYNYWIAANKKASVAAWQKANPGYTINHLARCLRTRGNAWDNIPSLGAEQDWWAQFVGGKSQYVDQFTLWNEPSLGWNLSSKDTTRPERHAALFVKLADQLLKTKPNGQFKILAPSIHGISDIPQIGLGLTYLKRFLAAVPASYKKYLKVDVHLYYGCLPVTRDPQGYVWDETGDMQNLSKIIGGYGFAMGDVAVSEFGSFYKSATQAPSSAEAATGTQAIYKTAVRAGMKPSNMYIWADETGPLAPFSADGKSLTAYGTLVKTLMQPNAPAITP